MFFCWVCKRKFSDAAKLEQHEQHSAFHASNVEKQLYEHVHKREEVRMAILESKAELRELETEVQGTHDPPSNEKLNRQAQLQKQMAQNAREYGIRQEYIESARTATKQSHIAEVTQHSKQPVKCFDIVELEAGVSTWQGGKDVQEDRFIFDKVLSGPKDEPIVGYAVFDGHSGHLCAEWVTSKLFEYIQKGLHKSRHSDRLTEEYFKKVVTEAFVLSDDEFCENSRANLDMDGTTAIVCFFWRDQYSSAQQTSETSTPNAREESDPVCSDLRLLVANVGDSRAVLAQKKGKILGKSCMNVSVNVGDQTKVVPWSPHGPVHGLRLSEDHKPDRPDEKKRVESRGGIVQDMTGVARVFTPTPLQIGNRLVQWGLAVSKSFGDLPLKDPKAFGGPSGVTDLVSVEPEITTFQITPGRDLVLMLACDGIWDVMTDQDAASVGFGHFRGGLEREIGRGPDNTISSRGSVVPAPRNAQGHAARGLVRESFQRYSLDNLTAMTVTIRPTMKWFEMVEKAVRSSNPGGKKIKSSTDRTSKRARPY